ncbi:hypothetical protein [Prochlorococcus marinus]|uniref:Uncharacterized protein n=1 Tax=Prochlorococcus marinus (strain MIT 9211) TaxID=93059 RepID=A9BCW2_PROM4|nr:hypothetical protein [Prochlorococcus marinus]ABX08050.1 Hypothetical protein P9211_01191 [Prochlorococcus marinus str. MIT 9211]
MEDQGNIKSENQSDPESKGLLQYDNDDKQVLFRLFGVEMTAPKGLKNPRIVYISFIVVNLILLLALKSLISN